MTWCSHPSTIEICGLLLKCCKLKAFCVYIFNKATASTKVIDLMHHCLKSKYTVYVQMYIYPWTILASY